MPTHDYIVANGTGAAVRADINSALSAIVSLNSNASEPGTMYAYQLWADTGSNPAVLKIRNSANSAWITLRQLDGDFSIVAVEDGFLATPSLTFTTDLNTGIFRPSTDSLGIVTGGQYAIACTSTQAVGIRTANPSAALHVAGVARIGADDATDAVLEIGAGATGNREAYIDLVGDTTYFDYGARLGRSAGANGITYFAHRGTGAISIQTTEAGPITFSTTNTERLRLSGTGDFVFKGAGTTPGTDKAVFFSNAAPINSMVLDSSGRLGIGTSNPGYKLDVTGPGTANGVTLNLSDVASVADSRHIQLTRSTSTAFLGIAGTATNDPFFISRSGTNSDFIINSTGKVGIGTTNPSYKLHVVATSSAAARFVVDNDAAGISALAITNDANADFETIIYTSKASIGSSVNIPICFHTNGKANEKMRLDTSGRLLVGTTSTSSTATIIAQGSNGGAAAPGIFRACHKTTPANDELFAYYLFGDSTHCDAAYIAAARDGGTWTSGTSHPTRLVFSVTENGLASPTERMRINNKGALKQSNTGSYNDATTVYNEFNVDNANSYVVMTRCTSATPLSEYIQDFRFSASAPNNTSARFWNCTDATAVRAYLASDGGLYNYSANDSNLSDRNAKKDISLAADTWDCIKEWEIVNYRYKDQPDDADLNLGVIAQQVAESCPEVITIFQEAKEATDDAPAQEERLGIKEQQMYWMAIKALQEAIARIETLETEVSALKGA